jgi:hypothetical protein
MDNSAYYTTLVTGTTEKDSNIMSLSSTRGVYIGQLVYCSAVSKYLEVVDIDRDNCLILLNQVVGQTASNMVVTFRDWNDPSEDDDEDEDQE